MNSTVSALDITIIVVYIIATTAFGAWFVRRSQTMDGFTLADKLIPGWAIGLSLLATYLSSISFLANPGKTYAADWSPFVFSLTLPVAIFIAARWFIPLYRREVKTTAYEYLEQRFGFGARAYMAIAYIMLQIGRFAVVLYLTALALAALLDTSIILIILALGVLTIIYTMLGGFAAVIWTDVVQSVVLLAGGLLCLILLVNGIPEGWSGLLERAQPDDKFSLGPTEFNLMVQGFWVIFLFGIVENLKNFSVDQNYVQRFLAAPSERDAVRSLWLGGLLYIPVSALFFLIGTALFAFYVGATGMPEQPDKVFPYFIVNELPAGLVGLVIAAVMAAGMSTLDSSLNSSSTVLTLDIVKRLRQQNMDDSAQLKSIRLFTVVIGITATLASLAMIEVKTALDVWWKISAIFGGGMLGLFLLAVMLRNTTSRQAFIATAAGVIFIAWATITTTWFKNGDYGFALHAMMIGVIGTLLIVTLGWLLNIMRLAR